MTTLAALLTMLTGVMAVEPEVVWLEAERFAEPGGWFNDSQFIDQMGSPYLLANGNGRPVADASTTARIPAAGAWRLWVRCRDWVPAHSPGRFQVVLGGQPAGAFGNSGKPGWLWQDGGEVTLPAGDVTVALRDETGWFGRCDAIVLTRGGFRPSDDPAELAAQRERFGAVSRSVAEHGPYDLVVVGGGLAGCAAAVAGARHGLKVALLQDRPLLGGNASDEIRVGPSGDTSQEPLDPGETGIIEELEPPGRSGSRSERYLGVVKEAPNLELFLNTRATGLSLDGKRITACGAVNVMTGERHTFRGALFADCTGDGWLGHWAGARYRTGREARAEFGEPAAPEAADSLHLSTSLPGSSIVTRQEPTPFVAPPWVPTWTSCDQFDPRPKPTVHSEGDEPPPGWHDLTRGPGRHPDDPNAVTAWWLETGGTQDTIAQAEDIRDELLKIKLGLWDHVKNHCPRFAKLNERREYVWSSPIAGKRESRRITGDYVLSQRDYMDARSSAGAKVHPDTVLYAGYNVDPHHPNGFWTSGPQAFRLYHYKVSVPFRILYAADVPNLFMAGRNVSATHIALNGVRVMRITALMGEVVGAAAALCRQRGVDPRGLYQHHIVDLQQALLRDGCYLMGMPNRDPADLARAATVTASSEATIADPRAGAEAGGTGPHGGTVHALGADRAVMFTAGADRLDSVELFLHNTGEEDVSLTAALCHSPMLGDFANGRELTKATATVPKAAAGWVKFDLATPLTPGHLYYVWLPKTEGLSWELYPTPMVGTSRAYRVDGWARQSHAYKFRLTPGGEPRPASLREPIRLAAANAIDGWNRAVAGEPHSWGFDPAAAGPHWLELKLAQPAKVAEVHVTFQRHDLAATDYDLAVPDGAGWRTVAEVRGNKLRRRVHPLDAVTTDRLRLVVLKPTTEAVQVCEVRVY